MYENKSNIKNWHLYFQWIYFNININCLILSLVSEKNVISVNLLIYFLGNKNIFKLRQFGNWLFLNTQCDLNLTQDSGNRSFYP